MELYGKATNKGLNAAKDRLRYLKACELYDNNRNNKSHKLRAIILLFKLAKKNLEGSREKLVNIFFDNVKRTSSDVTIDKNNEEINFLFSKAKKIGYNEFENDICNKIEEFSLRAVNYLSTIPRDGIQRTLYNFLAARGNPSANYASYQLDKPSGYDISHDSNIYLRKAAKQGYQKACATLFEKMQGRYCLSTRLTGGLLSYLLHHYLLPQSENIA